MFQKLLFAFWQVEAPFQDGCKLLLDIPAQVISKFPCLRTVMFVNMTIKAFLIIILICLFYFC